MNEIDLIKKVNDEIEEIEYIIKNEKKINKQNKMIKNLKITKNIYLLLMTYIIWSISWYQSFTNYLGRY